MHGVFQLAPHKLLIPRSASSVRDHGIVASTVFGCGHGNLEQQHRRNDGLEDEI
jgi:hypothetical protein